MSKKIFLFSKKKRFRLLALEILITLFSCGMLYVSLKSDKIYLAYILAFGGLSIAGFVMTAVQLWRIWNKEQVGLELDNRGFYFKATALGRKLGKISWTDIQAIQTASVYGSSQLFVKLSTPESYTTKISSSQIRKLIFESGFPLHAGELNIDFHEMETYIMQYYHQYHSA